MRKTLLFLFAIVFSLIVRAQDTLPKFSVTARGPGRILVSWHNHYHTVSQISIQRSTDSLRNFTTLLTVPDPRLPENGATDLKANHPNYYYRLFIVLEEGKYLFTSSKKPQAVTGVAPAAARDDVDETEALLPRTERQRIMFVEPDANKSRPAIRTPNNIKGGMREIEVQKTIFIKKGETVLGEIPGSRIRLFRDSLLNRTKDTLVFIDGDTLLIKPFVPKEIYRASTYVFTGKYGNVQVIIPDAARKHYMVRFYDEENRPLFELAAVKTSPLTVDKSNFHHAGWFRFELYEDGQLKEKNRFFIPKEF